MRRTETENYPAIRTHATQAQMCTPIVLKLKSYFSLFKYGNQCFPLNILANLPDFPTFIINITNKFVTLFKIHLFQCRNSVSKIMLKYPVIETLLLLLLFIIVTFYFFLSFKFWRRCVDFCFPCLNDCINKMFCF